MRNTTATVRAVRVTRGVGLRHEFTTRAGEHIGVVSHRTGRRDLLLYAPGDRDLYAAKAIEEYEPRIRVSGYWGVAGRLKDGDQILGHAACAFGSGQHEH